MEDTWGTQAIHTVNDEVFAEEEDENAIFSQDEGDDADEDDMADATAHHPASMHIKMDPALEEENTPQGEGSDENDLGLDDEDDDGDMGAKLPIKHAENDNDPAEQVAGADTPDADLDDESEGDDEEDDLGDPIADTDSWHVISAFFRRYGLVHQQVDSYNDFVTYKMQEIVSNHPPIQITAPSYTNDEEGDVQLVYRLRFGQLTLSRPSIEDKENETRPIWPLEARLRNLTYAAPLYVDILQEAVKIHPDGTEKKVQSHTYPGVPLGRVSLQP